MRLLLLMIGTTALAMAQMQLDWTESTPLPVPAAGGVTGIVNGAWLYAGGTTWSGGVKRWLTEVQRYDPQTSKWSAGPALPLPLAYGTVVRHADSIEVFGGAGETALSRGVWRLEGQQWKPNGETPADTIFSRAAEIKGKTYLFGGCASQADLTLCSDAVYVRDAGKWTKVSTLPHGRVAMPASAVAAGRVFLFGGCSMDPKAPLINRDDAVSYDPAKNTWRKLKPLPEANRGMAALALDENTILLAGGYATDFRAALLLYDIAKDQYTPIGDAPIAAAGMELLLHKGEVILMGGEPRMKERSARVFRAKLRR